MSHIEQCLDIGWDGKEDKFFFNLRYTVGFGIHLSDFWGQSLYYQPTPLRDIQEKNSFMHHNWSPKTTCLMDDGTDVCAC